jgi:hypothetical protein
MPATVGALADSLSGVPRLLIDRVAVAVRGSARPFPQLVELAIELLGGGVPDWPLLSEWNRWCVERGASFFVWRPSRDAFSDRERAEPLVHTLMMLSAKEQAMADYRASGIAEARVATAGDDCVICDAHRHAVVPLSPAAMGELPPFHPGCRCGFRPHLS